MRRILLVVLQCAYGKTAKARQALANEKIWRRLLWRSYTGKRLRQMIPEGWEIHVIEATPKIGTSASSVFPPDAAHIEKAVKSIAPDRILACGKVAQAGLQELGLEYIEAPHPAWRQLTQERINEVKTQLEM